MQNPRTRNLRLLIGLTALVLPWAAAPGQLSAADSFYANLLRDGNQAYLRGDYEAASKALRIACFGLLDEPELLTGGLVKLGLASARLGDQETFLEVFERILEVEEKFGAYTATPLPREVRTDFEVEVNRRVPSEVLQNAATFRPVQQEPVQPVPGQPALEQADMSNLSIKEQRATLEDRVRADPGSLEDRLELARLELDSGRPKRAKKWTREALSLEPGNPAATCLQGEANLDAGSCRDVVANLSRCSATSGTPSLANGYLGCLVKLDRFEEAATFFLSLPESHRQSQLMSSVAAKIPAEILAAAQVISPPALPAPGPSDQDLAKLRELQAALPEVATLDEIMSLMEQAEALTTENARWRDANLFAATVAYQASLWNDSVQMFRRSGGPDESRPELLFYYAVALYETGERQEAATALSRALPVLERDSFVDSYVEKILGKD